MRIYRTTKLRHFSVFESPEMIYMRRTVIFYLLVDRNNRENE